MIPSADDQYDVLILGIPTWDFGEIQEDWEAVWEQLDTLNLEAKSSRCTAWAISWATANGSLTRSACCTTSWRQRRKFIGYWPTEGYEFTSQNRLSPMASCLLASRWMKPTSTT
jgi:flavodoxin II